MVIVTSKERFFDSGARGRFGKAWEYGEKVYGEGHYGEEEIPFDTGEGEPDPRWGIYQKRTRHSKIQWVREKFYTPRNPQTEAQQAWRAVFATGMALWAGLTLEQRAVYNKDAVKYHFHGVNLYMRNWLNSN